MKYRRGNRPIRIPIDRDAVVETEPFPVFARRVSRPVRFVVDDVADLIELCTTLGAPSLDDTDLLRGDLLRAMTQRSLPVRALWFVFVGWWVTPIVVNTAWLLNVTVVLLPVGIKLINLVPTVLTLAEPRSLSEPESARGQRSLAVRAVYFVLVGWWLSLLWANAASFLAITVVGLPVAIWMLNRLPYVTSLYRFHG